MLLRLIEDGKPENFQLQIYIFTRLLSQNNRDNLYNVYLFPDAEVGEDVAEDFVGADFSGDGAKMIEGVTEVLGY